TVVPYAFAFASARSIDKAPDASSAMVTVAGRVTTAFAASTPGPVVGAGVAGAASLSTIFIRQAPPSVTTEPITELTSCNSSDPPATRAPTKSRGGGVLNIQEDGK